MIASRGVQQALVPLVVAGVVAVVLTRPLLAAETAASAEQANQAIRRDVQFGFEIKNTSGRLIEGVAIGILIPVQHAAGQRCCKVVTSSHPSETIRDSHGNQALSFTLHRLPPHAIKTIQVRATLTVTDTPAEAPEPDTDRWVSAEPLIQMDHPRIREQARRLQGTDRLRTARRVYDWISRNLDYGGYLRDARGALYALEKRRGDCTEYMHLFLALARAGGIPARGMAGYVVEQDAPIRAQAFHNWAEFYADGAWRIADVQRKQFDTGYGHYIATRILGVDSTEIPANAARFWVVGKGVRVEMQ